MTRRIGSLGVAACLVFSIGAFADSASAVATLPAELTGQSEECIDCHTEETPIIYQQRVPRWGRIGAVLRAAQCRSLPRSAARRAQLSVFIGVLRLFVISRSAVRVRPSAPNSS
jgi:hypothetical protein